MLPSVIFVGPTKCGTTWIDAYLRTRPEVGLPQFTKETFFFDKAFARGLDWYAAQFGADAGLGVEVAPSLYHKPEAARALAASLPEAQVVIMLRDPYERAVSHYFHYRKAGEPRRAIAEMAQAFPDVIEASLFFKHAQMWEELLPGRVRYLRYDQLRHDPQGFCQALCALLNIAYLPPPETLSSRQVNAASVPRHAQAARIGRRMAEWLRRIGAHGVVNRLRGTRLKRLLFSGGGNIDDERRDIRAEAQALQPITADLMALEPFLAQRGV
jgi:hypothetical protein